ncbi:MAG: DNA repair protein RecN [Bacteroidales bacterium]|nr:DNA repair protein RecN [Bacteroidales bacterium]
MLTELTISNYALIDKTELSLDKGMTIITGETGAGKSIMLGALGLILGQRADSQVLLDKEKKCVVEATFDISQLDLEERFAEEGVDYDKVTIIRREILPNGKSRAFVNDTVANVSFLKEIGQKLIDIHSQHQNLLLSDDSFHLNVIDAVAQTKDMLAEYGKAYKEYRKLAEQERQMREENERLKRDADFIAFQHKELSEAHLKAGELEELEQEQGMLANAETIKEALSYAVESLDGDEKVLSLLGTMSMKLSKVQNYLPADTDAVNRVENARIDLNDLLKSLEAVSERVEYDPDRIAEINRRIDVVYTLMQKHHVSSVDELIALEKEYADKLKVVNDFDSEIEDLQKRIAKQREVVAKIAEELTERRKSKFDEVTADIEDNLHEMGMGNARFVISHTTSEEYMPNGQDSIRFLFSANKNGDPTDISKVASGGEMARVMLSIKSLLSKSKNLPTIIFDEIDTGVSGEVADKMGRIMTDMASNMQVIAITHLPQVAAKGEAHYRVYKQDTDDRTLSAIEQLDDEQRVEELAKMLSGAQITEAALQNARTLLGR